MKGTSYPGGIALGMGWKRDTGEVGVYDVTDVDRLEDVFELKVLRCSDDGDCTVVSSSYLGARLTKRLPLTGRLSGKGRRSSLIFPSGSREPRGFSDEFPH